MTISSISPVAPVLLTDRAISAPAALGNQKADSPPPKAPFDPLPALRPTLQDQIAIDQTLMALREL